MVLFQTPNPQWCERGCVFCAFSAVCASSYFTSRHRCVFTDCVSAVCLCFSVSISSVSNDVRLPVWVSVCLSLYLAVCMCWHICLFQCLHRFCFQSICCLPVCLSLFVYLAISVYHHVCLSYQCCSLSTSMTHARTHTYKHTHARTWPHKHAHAHTHCCVY